MDKTKIYDLDQYHTNIRNGSYGGMAGSKEGITIEGEDWIVKYPQSTKGMRGEVASYTTAPLSEYIGSHIYQILGIDVHRTILGIRNGRLVVACKDFCKHSGDLKEIRTLKNVFNQKLSEILDANFSETSSSHLVDLGELMTHLKFNPILKDIPNVKERFWEQFIVDILINNNDRNNGNWGILCEDGVNRLAPVFDNGASFSNKATESKLETYLSDPLKLKNSALNTATIYSVGGKYLHARDILELEDEGLYNVALRLIPVIQNKMEDISGFIANIPEHHINIDVCSKVRKKFYIQSMEMRLEHYLLPAYKNAAQYFGKGHKSSDSLEEESVQVIFPSI